MNGESVSNASDGLGIDEERANRTVLVKSLPSSTNKQNLTIHFQSRKNGGGDIEELKLLDHGSAIITFKEEKVAKSVQKKEQRLHGVLLAVDQYNLEQEQMEDIQVFSKVSAMINPTKFSLTIQGTQELLEEIVEETKVDLARPQNKNVFILTGSFQQIQECYRLLQNCLSKSTVCNRNKSNKRDTAILNGFPKGIVNGKECHKNGTEELPSMKDNEKSASKKVYGRTTTTSIQFPKTSKESSTSEKECSSHNSMNHSKKEEIENHKENTSSKSSVKYLSSSTGTKTFNDTQGSLTNSSLNKEGNGPKGADTLSSGANRDEVKDKYNPRKKGSSIRSEVERTDSAQKIEISSKVWNAFVKLYEKELESVMTNFSVQIEPEDNNSVAIIKPSSEECNEEKVKMASGKLKELYEEASSRMKLVRFVLADPENKEHDSILRKTVIQVKKDFAVFLERAEDRQSWEIFGETSQVEKGLKLLEENVKLERKEPNAEVEKIEEADTEEDSDDTDDQNTDTDSADDLDEDDDYDIWNEKLEHHLGNVKVSVYKGDISEEKCDAIVNAANERLEHGAGVAWAIASKGGPSIQEECKRIVMAKGKLKVGDAAISHSGLLKCKMIIHAVGPNWKNDKGEKGKALLKKACKESLTQAEKYSFKSIAFPAISSGIFGMPKSICAQVMFDAAEEYSKSVTLSGMFGLRDIRFVNNDVKTVKVFRSEFKTRYGSGKVISEHKEDVASGNHLAYPLGNPSMRGNSKSLKISPTWKAESSDETTVKSRTYKTEAAKHWEIMSSHESYLSRQVNGLSPSPRGSKPLKENSSQPLAGNKTRHEQQPRVMEFKDEEPRNHSHSSKHGVVKSFSFSGGARPKQSQFSKDDASKCPICLTKIKQPKTLPRCNHTFCKTCLEKAIQQSPKCPYCREPLEDRQGSPTHGQAANGYHDHGDEFSFYGLNHYDDSDDDATLCLLCAKPVRQAEILPCRHAFCKPCIDRAMREYPSCPCCSELERNQRSYRSWNQDTYDQQFSNFQGGMNADFVQQQFPPDFHARPPRSNRGNRPPYAYNFDCPEEPFGYPGNSTRRGQPGRGTQPDGSMRYRQEKFSLPGYEGHETIVIQYSFQGGVQGPDHPNPGCMYNSTSRSAYLPDCPEGRKVLKLLSKAFDAGLLFRIGRSMTSRLDNQIIWADIPHKTSTSGGPAKYGYPDPAYLSDVKKQLQEALNGI